MEDESNKKISKIESYLHNELGYKPEVSTPDTESNVWRVLDSLQKVVKGGDNIMGIETKVKIMWWANYIIGFAAGFFCQAIIQKAFK